MKLSHSLVSALLHRFPPFLYHKFECLPLSSTTPPVCWSSNLCAKCCGDTPLRPSVRQESLPLLRPPMPRGSLSNRNSPANSAISVALAGDSIFPDCSTSRNSSTAPESPEQCLRPPRFETFFCSSIALRSGARLPCIRRPACGPNGTELGRYPRMSPTSPSSFAIFATRLNPTERSRIVRPPNIAKELGEVGDIRG